MPRSRRTLTPLLTRRRKSYGLSGLVSLCSCPRKRNATLVLKGMVFFCFIGSCLVPHRQSKVQMDRKIQRSRKERLGQIDLGSLCQLNQLIMKLKRRPVWKGLVHYQNLMLLKKTRGKLEL
ncbi:hypothetical protein LINPERPRIM_LOCUS26226 [Linum perenne]